MEHQKSNISKIPFLFLSCRFSDIFFYSLFPPPRDGKCLKKLKPSHERLVRGQQIFDACLDSDNYLQAVQCEKKKKKNLVETHGEGSRKTQECSMSLSVNRDVCVG